MNKTIFFLTSNYPFGTGETFIENEMPFLAEAFDKIIIISNDTENKQTREVPQNVRLLRWPYELADNKKWKALASLFKIDFWKEFLLVMKRKKLSIGILNTMLISLYKAGKTRDFLHHIAKKHAGESIHAYSYWCNDNALALALWRNDNKNINAICRTHGWDIYEERSEFNYLPYRKTISKYLNSIFFISEQGKNYWQEKYRKSENLKISRLGTLQVINSAKKNTDRESYLLVSCSSLIPLKRVHLIIEALSLISDDHKIQWVHFGDGFLREELMNKAENLLSEIENINWELKGHASNKTVLEFYAQNQPDLFINVSETEGVPVSIMEAFSCSIPTIATDVGGVSELVNDENGYLLPKNLKPEQLAEMIQQYLSSDVGVDTNICMKERKRKAAYATWEAKYNAERNYRKFVEELLKT